jgi:hypothetical protein
VDEDENEPAPSLARRPPVSLPHLLTNCLLPPLSLDEMRTRIEHIHAGETGTLMRIDGDGG